MASRAAFDVTTRLDYVTRPTTRGLVVRSPDGIVEWDVVRAVVRHTTPDGEVMEQVFEHDLDRDIVMGTQARAALDLRPTAPADERLARGAPATLADGIAAVRLCDEARAARRAGAPPPPPTPGPRRLRDRPHAPARARRHPRAGRLEGPAGQEHPPALRAAPHRAQHPRRRADARRSRGASSRPTPSEIAAVARSFGGEAPFLRPAELAGDDTPMAPVVRHALEWCEADEGVPYDAVLLLDPTSPARVPEQLAEATRRLAPHPDLDGVISVSEPTFNPVWVGVRPDPARADGALRASSTPAPGVTRRQDAGRFLRINGNFYLWRADFVRRLETSWFDEGTHAGAEIPESQAFSIDDEYEFRLIEALIVAGIIRLPWIERETP